MPASVRASVSPKSLAAALALARASVVSTALCAAIVTLLHILQPDLDVVGRTISEYVFSRAGWLITLALILEGLGTLGLAVALHHLLPDPRPMTGIVALAVFGATMILAGFFPTDSYDPAGPITITLPGIVHVASAFVGFTALIAAVPILTRRLAREHWPLSALLRFQTAFVLAGYVLVLLSICLRDLLVETFKWPALHGLTERLMFVAFLAWLATIALAATRTARSRSAGAALPTRNTPSA